MALARAPLLCNTRVLFAAGLNPADLNPSDFGITTNPTGYLTPQFTIAAQNGAGGWTAQIAVTRNAHEGANDARYLGAGFYSTGLMYSGGGLTAFAPGPNNRHIYVEVSAAIATLNRQAEQEHCDDMVRAYDLTLGAAQTALTTAVAGNPYAGATSADAVTAARDAITNGLHVRLQAVFNNNIDVNTATVDNAAFGTALGTLYENLCALSGMGRDAPGLHTFRPAGSESWSAWSWIEWGARKTLPVTGHNVLFGEKKDIRKLVTAPTFQVPGPATNVLIHL